VTTHTKRNADADWTTPRQLVTPDDFADAGLSRLFGVLADIEDRGWISEQCHVVRDVVVLHFGPANGSAYPRSAEHRFMFNGQLVAAANGHVLVVSFHCGHCGIQGRFAYVPIS
jgi:hypothetical protein